MSVAVPYPYDRWPRLHRVEAAAISRLARSALHAEGSTGARMIEVGSAVLGAELIVTPGAARAWTRAELAAALREPLVAVELSARHEGLDVCVVLELAAELASALVERVLGGDGAVRPPGLGLDELELGGLGYLAARMCAATSWLRVHRLAARAAEVLASLTDEAAGSASILMWPLELNVGSRAGFARVLFSAAATRALAGGSEPTRRFDVPSALLGLPLRLCAHAATVLLTAPEIAALEPGDVVVPERTELARGEHGWYGQLALHALGARGHTARCELSGHTLRAIGFGPCGQGEHAMSYDNSEEPGSEGLVKDAPIQVCVELARFTLRLEDVLGLRVGQVLQTGRAIGEHVLLTANGRTIARGELVDVEGDVGVRILEKHG